MNYEEIMARITAGEDPEAIVKEFTDNMNKANAELAAKREAEAAEAKAAEVELRKNDIADTIARCMNEYVVTCGFENPGVQCSDVRDMMDSMLDLIPLLKNLSIQIATPKTSKKFGIAGKGKPAVPEDVFTEFFKSLGI